MATISTSEMWTKHGSMEGWEIFRLKWIRACVRVNKHSKNAAALKDAEKRVMDIAMKSK